MTVLTDLSASMFAACFMILLVFLSLVQRHDTTPAEPPPIEATRAFALTRQRALGPSAMIDQLFVHGKASQGISIDLFADRIEVREPGGGQSRRLSANDLSAVAAGLARTNVPIRLQVFSNALYNQLVGQLENSGTEFTELTVAAAMRDPDRPDLAWAPAFLQLGETASDPRAFRIGLAALLQGTADPIPGAQAAPTRQSTVDAEPPGVVERIREWMKHFSQLFFPIAGLACVAWIERSRFGAIRDR
ncbi:hypothetical protein [Mesorhizobium sp. ANAO-SY3R2]|uniref:hypothetical protein n=1 Tax=Mesorhizobium sp. ANAO-SY3R2 TaxID=3166644 RepID=UPI00366C2E82